MRPVTQPQLLLVTPTSPQELDQVREIFLEYAQQLGIDLCFQGFDDELAQLPGDYAEPRGIIKLALNDTTGCLDLSKAGELGYAAAYNVIRDYCN